MTLQYLNSRINRAELKVQHVVEKSRQRVVVSRSRAATMPLVSLLCAHVHQNSVLWYELRNGEIARSQIVHNAVTVFFLFLRNRKILGNFICLSLFRSIFLVLFFFVFLFRSCYVLRFLRTSVDSRRRGGSISITNSTA